MKNKMQKEKYKIGNLLFSTKKEIKDYTTKIVESWYYSKEKLTPENIRFLFELIKNHPKISDYNYKAISVGLDVEYQTTICLKLKLENGNIIDFSYVKCIENLSQTNMIKIPKTKIVLDKYTNKLKFGKYKGKTIEWVWENDPDYIEWLLNRFEDESPIIHKIKKYLNSIGVVIEEKYDDEIIYTQEDLNKAIDDEDYELAALIQKVLNQLNESRVNAVLESMKARKEAINGSKTTSDIAKEVDRIVNGDEDENDEDEGDDLPF